jgi:hypothetical protein
MSEAGEALARAAAALVRDRERVRGAQSATGFEELVAQMRQLAGQQGQINQQAGGLPMPVPGADGQGARDQARRLARQQRGVAERLDELGDGDPSGRSDALAREARQLAEALERQAAPDAPSRTRRRSRASSSSTASCSTPDARSSRRTATSRASARRGRVSASRVWRRPRGSTRSRRFPLCGAELGRPACAERGGAAARRRVLPAPERRGGAVSSHAVSSRAMSSRALSPRTAGARGGCGGPAAAPGSRRSRRSWP